MHSPAQEKEWEKYRDTLLRAGLGYRWVTRHVQELQDHCEDLRQQALNAGQDAEVAHAYAVKQLGALPALAATVIATTRPMLLHRHPLLVATLLPALAYLLSCFVLAFVVFGVAYQAKAVLGATGAWLDVLVQLSIDIHAFVMLPVLGMGVALCCIRNRCCRPYWVAGLLVLCLSGSATNLSIELPDPARGQPSSIGVGMFYNLPQSPGFGKGQTNLLRLLLNLLLTGAAFHYSIVRDRQAKQEHSHAS